MLLYVRVIFQEKKIWVVQFRQCTALSNFVNCTALFDATICQSHFTRKKNLGGAIQTMHHPIWYNSLLESFSKKKKFGRCNSDNAPPYLIQLYVRVIFQEKKIGRCNSDNAPPRAVGRCMHRPSRCNLVISKIKPDDTDQFLQNHTFKFRPQIFQSVFRFKIQ